MKMRVIIMTLGLLTFIMPASDTQAQTWLGAGFGIAPNPLGLTPQQQSQVQEIVSKWQAELTPIWSALQAKGVELQALMGNPNAEPSAVETKTKEYSDLQAEVQRKSLELRNSIRDILSDEQKTIYNQMDSGYGWGRGPCGLGLGAAWGGGFGRGRGFGRGGGRGRGAGWGQGYGYGVGLGYGPPAGPGSYGPRRGRGPCGMGLGRTGFAPWMGRRPW